MISGSDFKKIFECEYLDANLQNSSDMNLNCIKDKSKGEKKLCTSDYSKIHDNIASNSLFIGIKRDTDAGYSVRPYNIPESLKDDTTKIKDKGIVEGFTNFERNSFIVPEPLGQRNIEQKCSDGYSYDGHKCIQVCTDCKYRDGMKSQEFNEFDKCFPEGVYNGIGRDGSRRCNCGKNNQYCSDKFINSFYPAGGFISEIKNFNINDLFDIRNL